MLKNINYSHADEKKYIFVATNAEKGDAVDLSRMKLTEKSSSTFKIIHIMKKVFVLAACACLFVSCSTLRKSSVSTMDVATSLDSRNAVDLVVSPTKISYTYIPTSQDKKTGLKNVVNNAVTDALKQNGNADVLVHMTYDATLKRRGKVKKVVVSGYPATYKNFK